jgi:hypothetical protein
MKPHNEKCSGVQSGDRDGHGIGTSSPSRTLINRPPHR